MATSSSHQDQKKEIMNFYDEMTNVIDNHKKTYNKLVEKINSPSHISSVSNKSLDSFMSSVLPKFKEFVNTVQERPFKCDVSYMYDTNKNKYIDVIDLPERFIVKEYSIDVMRVTIRHGINLCGDDFSKRFENKIHINDIYEYILYNKIQRLRVEKLSKTQTKLIFILDNYCNIYIPNLKLYILNNYSKYNLYSFYASCDGVFDLNEYLLLYIVHGDRQKVQSMCGFKSELLKSDDFKKQFIDLYLPAFLKEIKYESMINTVAPYMVLSDKYNLLNHQKCSEIINEKITVAETTDDETSDETTDGETTDGETTDDESIGDDKFTVDEITDDETSDDEIDNDNISDKYDDKNLKIKLDETFNLVNDLINKNKSKDLEYIENKKHKIKNIEEIRKLKIDNLKLKSKISKKTITNNNLKNKVKQQEKIIYHHLVKLTQILKNKK